MRCNIGNRRKYLEINRKDEVFGVQFYVLVAAVRTVVVLGVLIQGTSISLLAATAFILVPGGQFTGVIGAENRSDHFALAIAIQLMYAYACRSHQNSGSQQVNSDMLQGFFQKNENLCKGRIKCSAMQPKSRFCNLLDEFY